jgi:transposase
MWTRENRGLYERKCVRYPNDLTDREWALIEPLIPPAKRGGRGRVPSRGVGAVGNRLAVATAKSPA